MAKAFSAQTRLARMPLYSTEFVQDWVLKIELQFITDKNERSLKAAFISQNCKKKLKNKPGLVAGVKGRKRCKITLPE